MMTLPIIAMAHIRAERQLQLGRMLLALSAAALASCGPGFSGSSQSNASLQEIRERTTMRFIDDPVGATNAYRETFAMKKADGHREVVAEHLTACGELMGSDRSRKDVYLDYVLSKVDEPDVQLQGLAVAALKGTMDDATLDILFRKLDSKVDIVQIAAVGAIRFRANHGPRGATRGQIEATRSRLEDYCRNQVPAFGFLRSELCNR